MSKVILKLRKMYKDGYVFLRRCNLKRVVTKQKKAATNAFVLTKEQSKSAKNFYAEYKDISKYNARISINQSLSDDRSHQVIMGNFRNVDRNESSLFLH